MSNSPKKKDKNPNPYKDESKNQSRVPESKAGRYLYGVSKELGKVSWPSQHQLVVYTGVVIVSIAFFSLAFWGIDSGVLSGLKALINM